MYVTQIVTTNEEAVFYRGLDGPIDNARSQGMQRFEAEHPGQSIIDAFTFTERKYYSMHLCEDRQGLGCCEVCGGVVPRSALYDEINGSD